MGVTQSFGIAFDSTSSTADALHRLASRAGTEGRVATDDPDGWAVGYTRGMAAAIC